jgi:hypothetical protein
LGNIDLLDVERRRRVFFSVEEKKYLKERQERKE